MVNRVGLLAVAAAFACSVHAEELQVTVSGEACLLSNACTAALFNGGSTSGVAISPFTITYLLNTASAQLQNPEFGSNVLQYFNANFPVTSYTETIGSHTTFAAAGSGNFEFMNPSGPAQNNGYQMFGSAGGGCSGCSGFSFDHGVAPSVTQAQYMSFSDPLAD